MYVTNVSWRVIHKPGKLFISKICCFRPVPLWKCRIYVPKGASRRTGSHVSLCCFPAASFKSILNRFEGYRKPNDKFVPLSSAAVNWRSVPKSYRNAIYPGWLRAPASNSKIHYIIKGIIGNKQGFVLVIVLTSNSLFDVIKIYAVRKTLNMWVYPLKTNTLHSTKASTYRKIFWQIQMLYLSGCFSPQWMYVDNTFFHSPYSTSLIFGLSFHIHKQTDISDSVIKQLFSLVWYVYYVSYCTVNWLLLEDASGGVNVIQPQINLHSEISRIWDMFSD